MCPRREVVSVVRPVPRGGWSWGSAGCPWAPPRTGRRRRSRAGSPSAAWSRGAPARRTSATRSPDRDYPELATQRREDVLLGLELPALLDRAAAGAVGHLLLNVDEPRCPVSARSRRSGIAGWRLAGVLDRRVLHGSEAMPGTRGVRLHHGRRVVPARWRGAEACRAGATQRGGRQPSGQGAGFGRRTEDVHRREEARCCPAVGRSRYRKRSRSPSCGKRWRPCHTGRTSPGLREVECWILSNLSSVMWAGSEASAAAMLMCGIGWSPATARPPRRGTSRGRTIAVAAMRRLISKGSPR